jgi:hypothetical protein
VKLGKMKEVGGFGLGVLYVMKKELLEELLYFHLLLDFVNLVIRKEPPSG